jgi:hypothetical protein
VVNERYMDDETFALWKIWEQTDADRLEIAIALGRVPEEKTRGESTRAERLSSREPMLADTLIRKAA